MHGLRRLTWPAAALALATSGCEVPHNDVLVFATQTKVALDVSASPTNAGTPSFTLGYKREEGVWMPLVVNGRESTLLANPVSCDPSRRACFSVPAAVLAAFRECAEDNPPEQCLAVVADAIKYVGRAGDKSDTYSVFASFGGEFSGSGGGKVALAQFFATGIAAQKLAERPEAARALKAEDGTAQLVSAQQDEIERLRAAGAAEGKPAADEAKKLIDSAVACWNKDRTAYRAAAAGQLAADSDLLRLITGDDEGALRSWMAMSLAEQPKVKAITTATCP